jgi:hypothetical protein
VKPSSAADQHHAQHWILGQAEQVEEDTGGQRQRKVLDELDPLASTSRRRSS